MHYYYLFDASAAAHFYIESDRFKIVLGCLEKRRKDGRAFFYIPSFCIAEVLNTFAKYRYRYHKLNEPDYQQVRLKFLDHVQDRKWFYSYDLNRYHNLNCDFSLKIEHEFDTEYSLTETKFGDDLNTISKLLEEKGLDGNIGHFYLSTYDILIISMGMELKRILKDNVFIVTKDERLAKINNEGINRGERFAKALYLPNITISDLN